MIFCCSVWVVSGVGEGDITVGDWSAAAVGVGIGVLVADNVGDPLGAQLVKIRQVTTTPKIILIEKKVPLIRVFILFLLRK
jgi:hypothetical protein